MPDRLPSHAAADFEEARGLFAQLQALDGPRIIPEGRSRMFDHGAKTRLAVVLLHGLTNVPEQWAAFAPSLHAAGHTVVVPRLPGHGDADRSGKALARVRAEDFLATTNAAIDIAAGAGERVVVAGLSIGGAFAARCALDRTEVAHTVAIVPLFGLRRLGAPANAVLARALAVAPNFYVAWDPREVPSYGYLRFPTRAFAACLRIGRDVYRAARNGAPRNPVTMLLNAREPAVANALAQTIASRFERRRRGSGSVVMLAGLPANHDIIDPTNPRARVDLVYPALRALLES